MSQTSFVIAGASALFIGLAGNMQAATITIQDNWDAGARSWILGQDIRGQDPQGKEIAYFVVNQVNHNQISASPKASLSVSVSELSASANNNSGQSDVLPGSYGVALVTMLPTVDSPTSTGQGASPLTPVTAANVPAPIRVPDGGTTCLMLGGIFCGIVLLRKSSKPARAK